MAEIWTSQDAPPVAFKNRAITVFGYGAQGAAQAQNLKDSGCLVTVCLTPNSPSIERAKRDGFPVMTDPIAAAKQTEIAVLLVPDAVIPTLWNEICQALPSRVSVILAHGFAIHYQQLQFLPTHDVALVAPMGQGRIMREAFLNGSCIPAIVAIHQDASGHTLDTARAYGQAIGCARVGLIASTVKEETETDLFSEQTAVVGGFVELIRASFDTLVTAGYQPEVAYWSTLRELEGMARHLAQKGIAEGLKGISATARFGALTRGQRIVNEETRATLKTILSEIQSGKFFEELKIEAQEKYPKTETGVEALKNSTIEKVHQKFTSPLESL